MSKIEINKEIILLRKNVEQAKVHIIKKHTREVMKLRNYRGAGAQKEKRARKADRLAAEILAIKNMKNDEITKYVLSNPLNLKEVLDNKNSEALTRMMSRIASHKIFSEKIEEFKKKFTNYMEFLGPGRKKKAVMEWKENKKQKKKEVDDEKHDSDKLSEHEESEESDEDESSKGEDESDDDSESIVNNTEQLQNIIEDSEEEVSSIEKVPATDVKKQVKKSKKAPEEFEKTETLDINKPEKSQKRKKEAIEKKENVSNSKKTKKKKQKIDIPKVISKQAVVKKFTEILKEDESNVDKEEIDNETTEPSIQVEKEEDPFFVTSDGQSNYLSVAPIKSKSENQSKNYGDEDDEDGYRGNRFNKKKFSRQDHDKYFSNVSKFKNGNFNKASDARWDGPKRNGKAYDKEKPGRNANFSKFNDEQRDKSKPFRKQSKGGIESTSNEILHPSWEAKKKQQEALKKGFQGKKIVFGDDDV